MDDLWCQHEAGLLDLVSLFILQCPVEDVIPGATGLWGVGDDGLFQPARDVLWL